MTLDVLEHEATGTFRHWNNILTLSYVFRINLILFIMHPLGPSHLSFA
jgi:hypothetical protein